MNIEAKKKTKIVSETEKWGDSNGVFRFLHFIIITKIDKGLGIVLVQFKMQLQNWHDYNKTDYKHFTDWLQFNTLTMTTIQTLYWLSTIHTLQNWHDYNNIDYKHFTDQGNQCGKPT